MKNNKPIIVGIGELLWDIFPDEKKAGGAPINFVYHASQLGAEGYAISAIGNDALGTEILRVLDQNHIRHYMETTAYPTGTVMVELDNEGKPTYTIVEGVAWDHIPLTRQSVDLVKKADAICFGTLAQRSPVSRETVGKLLTYASEDALRFFDINIRQHYYSKELIEVCLESANVFKINDEELELIAQMFKLEGSTDDICQWFIEKYQLRYLVLTAGSEYSSIYGNNEKSMILTPKVKVADTVGAGDAFSGAFVYSILTGESLKAAHQKAVDIAAFVCTQNGAWPPYS
ncbi:MAG: carbohydrate kinase [Tannerella sp.]|jgi:fructokinase|nr:carbohydrate kinase [Tannerella sp.]